MIEQCPICQRGLRTDRLAANQGGTPHHFTRHMAGHGLVSVSLSDMEGLPLLFKCWCGVEASATEMERHYEEAGAKHVTNGYARARLDRAGESWE